MTEITRTELEEAKKAIESVIRKSEKVQETLSQKEPKPASQLTLLERRLKAFRLAITLIERELERN